MKLFLSENADKDIEHGPAAKLQLDRLRDKLASRAMDRQTACWMDTATGCSNSPIVHVQEVGFDFREVGSKTKTAIVSSSDIVGPVPGFCLACLAQAPPMLAEAVYSMQFPMRFGLKPTRWFIRYTDGTSHEGECKAFQLHQTEVVHHDRPAT